MDDLKRVVGLPLSRSNDDYTDAEIWLETEEGPAIKTLMTPDVVATCAQRLVEMYLRQSSHIASTTGHAGILGSPVALAEAVPAPAAALVLMSLVLRSSAVQPNFWMAPDLAEELGKHLIDAAKQARLFEGLTEH